jgi:hypothetical protein
VVRNDFLDFMTELRKWGKSEVQEDRLSDKNPRKDATFSKFKTNVTTKQAAVSIRIIKNRFRWSLIEPDEM